MNYYDELLEKMPLSDEEKELVEETSEKVENVRVRIALKKAMTANFEFKIR